MFGRDVRRTVSQDERRGNFHSERNDRDGYDNQRSDFSPMSSQGFFLGKSIASMINNMPISEEEKEEFIKGLNRAIFKEVRIKRGDIPVYQERDRR